MNILIAADIGSGARDLVRTAWTIAVGIGWALSAWAQVPIRLKTGEFDPLRGRKLPALAASQQGIPRHFILQFRQAPDDAVLTELDRRGIRVLSAVPDNAVMAVLPDVWDLEGLDLRWAGWLSAAEKISPAAATSPATGWLFVFHPDVDIGDARRLLVDGGLDLLDRSDLLPSQLLATGSYERVQAVAAADEVAYVLPASTDLLSGTPVIACPGPLTEAGAIAEYVRAGPGWTAVDGQVNLQYAYGSLTSKMDPNTVRTELARALNEWTRYAPVNFTQGGVQNSARTVWLLFGKGSHGDPYPFDGPGKVLAHTFYPSPPNAEPQAGDIHFDDDEPWSAGGTTDLFSVALHEAGHALGLGHSDKPGAVMYPYYRAATVLSADDIAGIQALYGTRDGSTPRAPSTPTAPTVPATPSVPATPTIPSSPSTPVTDTTPPSLRISSPGTTIVSTSSATISFSGTAADNVGVVAVKWSMASGASGTASGTTAWTASIPLIQGTNTVTVRAYDAAGNSSWRAVTVVRR